MSDLARHLVRLLPSHYLREPFEVRFEDPATGLGRVGWSGGRWVIRLSPRLRGRGLLHVCLHEIGHVVLGHVVPEEGGRVHQGRPPDPAEQGLVRLLRAEWEREADKWASEKLPTWLSGLERYL